MKLAASFFAAVSLLALGACASTPAGEPAAAVETDAALAAAAAGAWRTPENAARDPLRKPAEALSFWGLKPGMTVLEISPGRGYWTEILAPYAAKTNGRYIATAADLGNPDLSQAAKDARAKFEARFADPALYGNVQYVNFGPKSQGLGEDGAVDIRSQRPQHPQLDGGRRPRQGARRSVRRPEARRIKDGEDGLLGPIDAPKAMADAIARVLLDAALAKHLSTAGRSRFEEGFTHEVAVANYSTLFERLLREGRRT